MRYGIPFARPCWHSRASRATRFRARTRVMEEDIIRERAGIVIGRQRGSTLTSRRATFHHVRAQGHAPWAHTMEFRTGGNVARASLPWNFVISCALSSTVATAAATERGFRAITGKNAQSTSDINCHKTVGRANQLSRARARAHIGRREESRSHHERGPRTKVERRE